MSQGWIPNSFSRRSRLPTNWVGARRQAWLIYRFLRNYLIPLAPADRHNQPIRPLLRWSKYWFHIHICRPQRKAQRPTKLNDSLFICIYYLGLYITNVYSDLSAFACRIPLKLPVLCCRLVSCIAWSYLFVWVICKEYWSGRNLYRAHEYMLRTKYKFQANNIPSLQTI